jgi:uncharacterized membrane protein
MPRETSIPAQAATRIALLLWSAGILAAVAAAPLSASEARPEGWFLYQAFEPFCHQQAGRSWHLWGHPLAVCARCLGFYAGMLLAALAGLRLPAKTIAAALALLVASWVVEVTGLAQVSNSIRSATGLLLGASIGGGALAWMHQHAPRGVPQTNAAAGCSS